MSLHCIVLFHHQSPEEDASRAWRGPKDHNTAHAERRRRLHADHQRKSRKRRNESRTKCVVIFEKKSQYLYHYAHRVPHPVWDYFVDHVMLIMSFLLLTKQSQANPNIQIKVNKMLS